MTPDIPTAGDLRSAWEAWGGTFSDFMADLDARQVPYLSHSKVATLARCPQCYVRQYVLGKQPDSDALTTGLLFHEAAAAFYRARRDGAAAADSAPAAPEHPCEALQSLLDNAVATLAANAWDGHEILGVEELFFLDLADGLPPAIGIIDLVLASDDGCVVVDHKTCKTFVWQDSDQLVLYAEHVRRSRRCEVRKGAFDAYRLVPSLKRARTPVFRRTLVNVGLERLPGLVASYCHAWRRLPAIHRERRAAPADDCWFCRRENWT